jgi:hypothetical protein
MKAALFRDFARRRAEITTDLVIQHQVEFLRQRPRSILELVAQFGAELGLEAPEVRAKLGPWCQLSPAALSVTGGDLPPPRPLTLVVRS